MSSIVASRLSPSHAVYSNELNWLQPQNGTKSPSCKQNCKCNQKIVEKKKEDCDNKNEEIRFEKILEDKYVYELEKLSIEKKNRSVERPSSGKTQRKQLLSPSKPEDSPTAVRVLEKSNSLSESKPPKKLRTTKSLSPRPPIKHQYAVTVSDEHNVVSLKVSPTDDFDAVLNDSTRNNLFVSDSSPEGVFVGSLQLDDRHKNNRSTSCLVYVPMDPWTKMETSRTKKKNKNRTKKLVDVKSLSRPDLVEDDPWVFDECRRSNKSKTSTYQRHSQSKSVESKSGTSRPRLHRSKSPAVVTDESIKNPPSSPVNLSPQEPLSSLSPKLGYNSVRKDNNSKKKNQFLNVSNPNLLQPRHSFSTPKKDDELTLNIRRLSEQIKHSSNYASYGNFTTENTGITSPVKPGEMEKKSASVLSDSLLETTC